MAQTHTGVQIKDPKTGLIKTVYVRTKETEKQLEQDRLGTLGMLEPIQHPELGGFLHHRNAVVVTPYLSGQRTILTRLLYDKKPHKVMLGTQLVDSFVRSESYLEGFPQFAQFYLQFSYNESPNRRLADLVNEIMGLRFHLGLHSWLIIPRPLPELAAQWGESLLNLSYLPRLVLPASIGELMGPNSTAKTDPTLRPNQGGPVTTSMDNESARAPDTRFVPKDKRRK